MTDREKVIRAIECVRDAPKRCGNPCETWGAGCAYAEAIMLPDGELLRPYVCDKERLFNDVIALLEAQEPTEPGRAGFPDASRSYGTWHYICGACGGAIDYKDKFCRWCGRGVKWDD